MRALERLAKRIDALMGDEQVLEFDMRTGQSYCDPSRLKVRAYPVTVARGDGLVEGPFVAETFPVTVEDSYVLIDV